MTASALPILPACALLALLATPAGAQTAPEAPPASSPEQARMLEQQVQAWLVKITAGAVAVPEHLVQFTPDGNGYDIAVPLGTLAEVEPKDAAVTAKAHMIDATRWAIDSEQLPPTLKVTTRQRFPNPAEPGAPPAAPTEANTHLETVTYEVKIGPQTVTGVFDPSYATPASSQTSIASVDIVQVGGPAGMISHIGPITSASSTTPSGGDRSDMLLDTAMQDYQTKTEFAGGGGAVTLTADRLHVTSAVTGLAHDRLATLIGVAVTTAKLVQAPASPAALPPTAPGLPPATPKPGARVPPKPATPKPGAPRPAAGAQPPGAPQDAPDTAANDARTRANLRALLVAANGLLSGGKLDEAADGVKFDVGGHVGTLTHFDFNLAGDAPQDALTTSFGMTLDGLVLADLPPALARYVPSHFAIHPTLSNISVAALTKLGMDASAPDAHGRPPEADLAALFQHGGINFGFDTLGLDIGDTKLSGTGSFNMAGPQTVTGQAEITARGLDALITQAQGDPLLAQGVPVLIFLKGIAKTNADQSVWQVSVANGRALVNGVNLSAMMTGMK